MSSAPSRLEPVPDRDRRRRRAQAGQGLAEYELLIALGGLLVIVAMLFLAGKLDGVVRGAGESASDPTFVPPAGGQQCDASYQGVCIPSPPPVLTCADLAGMGIPLPVSLVGTNDPHNLDPDGDGLGC
jgi:hypothetical protein